MEMEAVVAARGAGDLKKVLWKTKLFELFEV